jgi:putative tricarboxylic transport membrane protein
MLMIEHPHFIYHVVAMTTLASVTILLFGLFLVRPLIKVLQVPRDIIMPIVFVLCVIGSYAISQRLFDIWTMLGFGAVGYVLRRFNYPMAPFVLGIVLGDLLDKNLRRGLVLSDGDLTPFFTRPISIVLWGITLLAILMNITAVHAALGRATAAVKAKIGFAR